MAQIAITEFQCAANDYGCYCTKSNYGYGVRDCVNQACSQGDAAAAIAYAAAQCASPASASVNSAIGLSSVAVSTSALEMTSSIPTVATSPNSKSTTVLSVTRPLSGTSSASPTTTSQKFRERPGSELSAGAKAGIAIAVLIVVLLLIGVLYMLWRRKQHAAAASHLDEAPVSPSNGAVAQGLLVPADEGNHDPTKPELDSTTAALPPPPVYEMHEMSGTTDVNRQELDGIPRRTNEIGHLELPASITASRTQLAELKDTSIQPTAADEDSIVVDRARTEIGNDRASQMEQLRAQRAAVIRERERMEEIARLRAEEEKLDRAIAELDSK
ncbi:hypothetical protein EK21DRAFT_118066 [Setomelanomma holmii]|uniref:CFEM domain-containing protein n=1 Tax=Setomelanomma holmii TaxID=210430 RepID=A0A9P4GWB4_9PLEO|nr:hypothetical protein EK21DRAFT_118066 [Setomelanomma holmii]